MASLVSLAKSHWRIVFKIDQEGRKGLYLGAMSRRNAEIIKTHVERILSADKFGGILEDATKKWISELPEEFAEKMVRAGLLQPAGDSTLGGWTKSYIASRVDVSDRTRERLNYARTMLLEYFDEERSLTSITKGEADAYRHYLSKKYAENTVRRQCSRAKQFFRAAVRSELLDRSPFEDMKQILVRANRVRDYFVTEEDAKKVLAACPNVHWKLIFALARWGGCRVPSEIAALKWADVNWSERKFTIRSTKTHKYESGIRIVPIFPELAPLFDQMWEIAPKYDKKKPETTLVFAGKIDAYSNLRGDMHDIIIRAGLKPWDKLFMNLRATRATELHDQFPSHVVTEWLGHSASIAREHYLRVTDEHFSKAVGAVPSKNTAKNARKVKT